MTGRAWDTSGFHGKLPVRGDFVTRGLPSALVDVLDAWLQDGIAASRDALGPAWLDRYLTSPIWHLALDGGIAGESPVAALLIPSVDAVGRYFPLLVAAPLGTGCGLLATSRWRRRAEDAALFALQEAESLDAVEQTVAALGPPEPETVAMPECACVTMAEEMLRTRHQERLAILWTEGTESIAPLLLADGDLPCPAAFTSLFDGDRPRLDGFGITTIGAGTP